MLQIENLVFNAWGRRFFDQANVSLPPGLKVGLVGRNGVGKTTLLKLIQGHHTPDGGPRVDTPPPGLGEHTAEILADLGYSEAEQQRLRAAHVI